MTDEFLTQCRFYWESDKVTEKIIKEIRGIQTESAPAGQAQPIGCAKGGGHIRQVTPTLEKHNEVTIKFVSSKDKDVWDWYDKTNRYKKSGNKWKDQPGRQRVQITAYHQDGSVAAMWELTNAYPRRYTGPDFNAIGSEMAHETVVLVYEEFERIQ